MRSLLRDSPLAIGVMALICGCGGSATSVEPADDSTVGFLVDRTGKSWNIRHAIDEYGMVPGDFQFGLGPDAIRPVNDPQFLTESDEAYPEADETFLVIGAEFDGEARAYPLHILRQREVVNEFVQDAHVAVAY